MSRMTRVCGIAFVGAVVGCAVQPDDRAPLGSGAESSAPPATVATLTFANQYPRPRVLACPVTPLDDCPYGLRDDGFLEVLPIPLVLPWLPPPTGPYETCPVLPRTREGYFTTMTGQEFLQSMSFDEYDQPLPLPQGGGGVVRVDPSSALKLMLTLYYATDFDWNRPFCVHLWHPYIGALSTSPPTTSLVCGGGFEVQALCEWVAPPIHGGTSCQGNCSLPGSAP
jgi:hypothetical protein